VWDGFQWITTDSRVKEQQNAAGRKLRRLYIGNLPVHLGVTELIFREHLLARMREENIIEPGGMPNLNVWFATDTGQGFGFLELETSEMAEHVLAKLDGMLVLGEPIQIKRPTDYAGLTAGAPPGLAAIMGSLFGLFGF